jgi:hypothetical protein
MHFHFIDPVLEGVGDTHRGIRELAFLADGDEARRQLMCDRAAENESAGLDPGDAIDVRTEPRLHQLVHDRTENARIPQQCRDVAETDARFRIVGNGADGFADLAQQLRVHARTLR